jgi:antitoxin ParD1/3/4
MRSMEIEMPTRNVVLTETQTQLIDRLVADGRFQNASEAMRAGLRLLEREEVEMTDLRTRLAAGLREARAGAFADGTGEDAIRRAFAAAREAS